MHHVTLIFPAAALTVSVITLLGKVSNYYVIFLSGNRSSLCGCCSVLNEKKSAWHPVPSRNMVQGQSLLTGDIHQYHGADYLIKYELPILVLACTYWEICSAYLSILSKMGITAIPLDVKRHWSWNFNCVEHCECSQSFQHLLWSEWFWPFLQMWTWHLRAVEWYPENHK